MSEWWEGLSTREQWLLKVLGGMVGVFLIWLLVLLPVQKFEREALQAYQESKSTMSYVNAAARNAANAQSTDGSEQELRTIITSTAQQFNLRWGNIRSNQIDMSLSVSFTNVSGATLLSWLADLESRENVVVRSARITRSRDGQAVDASLTLSR